MDSLQTEERTAHHVRRLHTSIRDLQNALGAASRVREPPPRPARNSIVPDTSASEDPQSRIKASNERGAVQQIEVLFRIHEVGAVVLGLEGVGALVADALCRYGVKRLVVGDTLEIGRRDLDYSTFYAQDIGTTRESRVANASRTLDPEIDVFSLGVALANTTAVVQSLRGMLIAEDEADDEDDRPASRDSGYACSDDEAKISGDASKPSDGARHFYGELFDINDGPDDGSELCFSVVFVCGHFPELAMALNELCCEFGVQLVYVDSGTNGISGDTLSVVPGHSACLQCLEKRKVLKLNPKLSTDDKTADYAASLPTTQCVLAGIAVQHAFAYLLDAGPICSRVEYDGFLEEIDRSGFIAPVHQCSSAYCRQQQQQHLE